MSTANHPIQSKSDASAEMTSLFTSVRADLDQVESQLQSVLRHADPFIDELAQHTFRYGGKRLRPALLLLSGQAVGAINNEHRTLAAVVEMIHTATLVHDDVLDEAAIRRHEDTVNARWDNQTSILLGDYLFTHALYLASSLDTTFACRILGQSTNMVCEGELRQTAVSGNFSLSQDKYLEIIEAKTAALCACCCQLGAHYAGGDQQTTHLLEQFGQKLGVAFQIVDDLLDLIGEEQTLGKSLGTDLAKHRMTLPLIKLRDLLEPESQQKLQSLLELPNSENTATLVDWLKSSGALQLARELANDYAEQAARHLDHLPDSSAKQALQEIAKASVSRCA